MGRRRIGAEVKLMVPMASPSNAIQWESDNESVVSVEASSEDGTRAVLTGNDIGAAAVTASYTETINGKEYTVSDTVHVSVGGDFLVTAAPETAKIGDIISFTASAKKAAKTSGMVTATASDAAYTWTIDDGSVAEIETSEPRKMTAKSCGRRNATASVRFEDEASDNRAEGSTSFTVEAPEVSLAVPETVTLGQTLQAETKVSNYTGKDQKVWELLYIRILMQRLWYPPEMWTSMWPSMYRQRTQKARSMPFFPIRRPMEKQKKQHYPERLL